MGWRILVNFIPRDKILSCQMALARAIFVSDVTLKITIKKKHYD
jgi:hypothetical protein